MCDKHPDILTTDVWVTIGFTYNEWNRKYYLIKHEVGLCLACIMQLAPEIKAFCYECKSPRPLDWTTGNKSLDSFIMKSWSNTTNVDDAYLQWIEYSLLTDVQQMTSLTSRHGCTRIADWLEPTANKWTKVALKQIDDDQSLDFNQVIIHVV